MGIGFVSRRGRVALDTAIGVMFTGAFALGVFLMSRRTTYNIDLEGYLFGNVLAVSRGDLVLIVGLAALVAASIVVLYRPLLYTSFDPVVAQASGINVGFVDYALLVLLALTIIVSLESVGIVLVAALARDARCRCVSADAPVQDDVRPVGRDRDGLQHPGPILVVLFEFGQRRDDRLVGDDRVLYGVFCRASIAARSLSEPIPVIAS